MTEKQSPPWQARGNKKTGNGKATAGKEYPAIASAVNRNCQHCQYIHVGGGVHVGY